MSLTQLEVPQSVPLKELSWRANFASLIIRENLASIEKDAPGVPTHEANVNHLLSAKGSEFGGGEEATKLRVGIIGAGVAGLFTAMIFDHLRDKFGLDVEYEILEAKDEVGGRLYSYYFTKREDPPTKPNHDYYDVGAMRFPKNKIMFRTFALFDELKMEEFPNPTTKNPPPRGALIPYYLSGAGQPALYNGIQRVAKNPDQEWTATDFKIPNLPPAVMNVGVGTLIDKTIKEFTDVYSKQGPEAFWKNLMEKADLYTVREWLTMKSGDYTYNTIEFLETMNYGNRWYDQALSEMILETLDFSLGPKEDWFCVEGGSQELAYNMQKKIKDQRALEFGKTVAGLAYRSEYKIDVNVKGESEPRTYDAVFNSVPLGAMQHMQLEGLNLNWGTKQAIRSLGYGASCKVGIRFSNHWWRKKYGIQVGQAKTDLPLRCCVYPSYNYYDPEDEPGVLLVSYTWSQEAQRIAALIDRQSPSNETELKEVLLHDLARLHTDNDKDYQELHAELEKSYMTHYAYDWYSNPRTAGAFAYFGPQQFKNMYQYIVRNDGKHIIIGEGASAHHAWVVGALESAVRGVYQFLYRFSKINKAAAEAAQAYEANKVDAPFGPLPAEFDRTNDVSPPQDASVDKEKKLPSAIGDMLRLGVIFEKTRIKEGGDRVDPATLTKDRVGNIVGVHS